MMSYMLLDTFFQSSLEYCARALKYVNKTITILINAIKNCVVISLGLEMNYKSEPYTSV